jgi:hypothetical protein
LILSSCQSSIKLLVEILDFEAFLTFSTSFLDIASQNYDRRKPSHCLDFAYNQNLILRTIGLSEPFTAEILFDHLDSIVFFIQKTNCWEDSNGRVWRAGSHEVTTVFAGSPIHFVGELSKPQTWNNIPMKQAFSMSTPTHRE